MRYVSSENNEPTDLELVTMASPTWEQYMVPSLQALADGAVRSSREIQVLAGDALRLSEEARSAVIPSGGEQWRNRSNWALSYLSRAGAVTRPTRGRYQITDIGARLLSTHSQGLTERDLRSVPGYESPRSRRETTIPRVPSTELSNADPLDPDEQIADGIARINADVADQLLRRIQAQEPVFFEQAVLDLLMAMGYGGAEGSATRTQLSRDGGIDGIIDQDALGLSRIYVQAKRFAAANTVGRPAIQEFVGALAGNSANQGVFITTSRFSADASAYASQVQARVILIDGDRLTRLMIRYGVGIQIRRTVQIVELDEDFFE